MKTIKQDFLMFRGTKKEVNEVESIDKCFYFAWDTGELFVGNSVGKKTPYGSSSFVVNELFTKVEKQNEIIEDLIKRIEDLENKTQG